MKIDILISVDKQIIKTDNAKDVFHKENSILILDGWTLENYKNYHPDSNFKFTGVFNIIFWDKNKKKLTIENDILGQRALYIGIFNNYIYISWNFWHVLSNIKKYSYENDILQQFLYFRRIAPSWKTPLNNIYKMPAGGILKYDAVKNNLSIHQKNIMIQKPAEISLDKATDQLDESISKLFSVINEKFAGYDIYFGNSGGLDSRMIPAYAKEFNLKVKGFQVVNRAPNGWCNQSSLSAKKIARYFGIPHQTIPFNHSDGWKRLLRDLYVNPFGPANFHKNPDFSYFKNSLILNGGSSFIITNDSNYWMSAIRQSDPLKDFATKHFLRSNLTIPQKIFSNYIDKIKSQLFNDHPTETIDTFSLMRTLHQVFLNHTSPAGAFESMSFIDEFQYIYHPFATEISFKWPKSFFYNRSLQLSLFKKKFPYLLDIPDQNGQYISKSDLSVIKKSTYQKMRTNGLDYTNWIESKWFNELQLKCSKNVQLLNSNFSQEIYELSNRFLNINDKLDMIKIAILIGLIQYPELLIQENEIYLDNFC